MSAQAAQAGPWSAKEVDIASHGAVAFTQVYYEAYDDQSRRSTDVPKMFIPDARVIWNGNAVPTEPANMAAFLDKMPLSRHDVQTVDCHPLTSPSPNAPTFAPDIVVNISGAILHGPQVLLGKYAGTNGVSNSTSNSNSNSRGPGGTDPSTLIPQDHPKKFHEVFVLRAIGVEGGGKQPKYAIYSSTFRFIG